MTMKPETDERLLADLCSNDREARERAQERLFESYRPALERLLARILGPDVDDCLQEVFVDVFAGLETFEGRSKLSTWIWRVALRRAWKCAARARRGDLGRSEDPSLAEAAADPQSEVGALLDEAELAQRFRAALERLDLDQRTVLGLAAVDGLGPGEIAEVLGTPLGTVHSRLASARARMAELLGLDGP
jgi:RNA polymerase sigma-70 factor (ECF subfamily)